MSTIQTASLANVTPAGRAAKGTGSNYNITDFLTGEKLGSSPAMNKKRAARLGVSEESVKNFYVGSNGTTMIRTYLEVNPGAKVIDAVNAVRKAWNPKASEVAMLPDMQKILDQAINGSDRATSAVKDKSAALAAKTAAIQALGLSGHLQVNESNNGTRTTITHIEAVTETPAPEVPAEVITEVVSPEVAAEVITEGKSKKNK